MSTENTGETLLDLFIFETSQNIEQLEQIILCNEKNKSFTAEAVNEIFRIMHTIKGSAAMMQFDNISSLAHRLEDLFNYLREHSDEMQDWDGVPDLVLESLDYFREGLAKIKGGAPADGDASISESKITDYLNRIRREQEGEMPPKAARPREQKIAAAKGRKSARRKTYKARVFFEDGCQMESIRAFDIVHKLSELAEISGYVPGDIMDNDDSASLIREKGFEVVFSTGISEKKIRKFFSQILFLRELDLKRAEEKDTPDEMPDDAWEEGVNGEQQQPEEERASKSAAVAGEVPADANQSAAAIINVNVAKLDKLMDLVGEMVITEAMVVQNPDLSGLELNNFSKAARQLHKITAELQDTVMSIRMVPLADIFQKMHRVVRDMSRKLSREIRLEMIGENTEVDKNIIKHLSDPLMHLVRNAIDHGIEDSFLREQKGKPRVGTVTLEAKNEGNDVLVIVRDDGDGLDRNKILEKAKKNGLVKKDPSELTDKEIFNLIFIPGFSTNEEVTEFSGRGVGMDVVVSNIEEVGGSVTVDSQEGMGTTVTIKIPLTLAIIDGMNIRVGNCCYTIPTTSIKESFRPGKKDLLADPDGNEMIMVRGICYAVVRLHECFSVKTDITDFTRGIFIMVEQYGQTVCIFADELVGQQQVVVKALPDYIRKVRKINGLAGCTLLGDGSISLILDTGYFVGLRK